MQESDIIEVLPIAPRVYDDGPVIEFNPDDIDIEDLEDPTIAKIWIPLIVHDFCMIVLREALADEEDGIGCLTAPGWQRFRDEVCEHMTITWQKVLDCAEREGEEYTAHSMAIAMCAETRSHSKGSSLLSMLDTGSPLRSAT